MRKQHILESSVLVAKFSHLGLLDEDVVHFAELFERDGLGLEHIDLRVMRQCAYCSTSSHSCKGILKLLERNFHVHRRGPELDVLELDGVAVGFVELSGLAIQPAIAHINRANAE